MGHRHFDPSTDTGNVFHHIPAPSSEEFVEVLARGAQIRVERIVSLGHRSPDGSWYDQDEDEWLILLSGSATLAFDNGERLELAPGDFVNLPAHRRHRVESTDPEHETVWLAVFYRETASLADQFGDIDIYLFDQLLRGRISHGMTILDAGCGAGRNLVYLMRQGFEVFGLDENAAAIAKLREMATTLAPGLAIENFHVESIETTTFPDRCADIVISNAVLHFARDEAHFWDMLRATWRVLQTDGLLFCRLASTIGIEHRVTQLEGRRFRLPDGTERFLVDEALLTQAAGRLGGELVDRLKTTVVQNMRSMTTWVLRKVA